MKVVLAVMCMALMPIVSAQNVPPPPVLQPIPEAPLPPNASAAGLEPEVTIRAEGDNRVEEYRIRGRLYMVKVTPRVGAPYYLVDQRGDGLLTRYDGPGGDLKVPMWLITSW